VKTTLLKVVWLWCSQDFADARFPLNLLNGAKKMAQLGRKLQIEGTGLK
jgi:hypothetical protein